MRLYTCTTCTWCAPYITILLVLLQYRYTCTGAPYYLLYPVPLQIQNRCVPNFAFFLPFFLSSSTFFDEPCSFTSLVVSLFLCFDASLLFYLRRSMSSMVGALFTPMHVGYALRWRFLFFPIPPDSTKSCTPTPSFLWKNESIQQSIGACVVLMGFRNVIGLFFIGVTSSLLLPVKFWYYR